MKTLDILECAEFLKIERTHALTLAGAGKLPGAKIGRGWVFLEEDLAEYLRNEVRRQQRERLNEAAVKDDLQASVERTPKMIVSPRAIAKRGKTPKRFDLSAYNDDGTPKLLSELAAG